MSFETSDHLSIEDIILSNDCRGVSALRPFLLSSYCEEAARFILNKRSANNKTVVITTGFFVLNAQASETDGPLGAIALARSLNYLDFEVVFVTDRYAMPLFDLGEWQKSHVIEFPITDHTTSRDFAQYLLTDLKPAFLIT